MKTAKNLKNILGGSLAAATLAGAAVVAQAPAASANGSAWDSLAECESNGNWSINTGNGYYGGLQFSLQSWRAVGGEGYPHQASKQEQIHRAEQLQSIQGWGAWPACSARLGLSGSAGTSTPSDNSGGSTSTGPAPQQQSPAPQQTQQPAPAPQPQTQQPAPQTETPAPSYSAAGEQTAQPNTDVQISDETYTIQSGDSLSSIAAELDVDWKDIWGANADTIDDPNLIFVGDELKLPVIG